MNPPDRTTNSTASHRSSPSEDDRYELERFKSQVDLSVFAASKGYVVDQRESSANCRVMRHEPTGDKIILGKAKDGHWQYFSVRDRDDNGTIIDFIQHRERNSLGQVRRELREWTHTDRDLPTFARRPIEPVTKDRAAVALAVARSTVVETHPYLESRGLNRDTLGADRFRGTWRQAEGRYRNVIFLHYDADGLSGFEAKNEGGFTSFSKGGDKGLWSSNVQPNDSRLVVAESAIDAISYHQVNPHPRTRYVSFAGEMNERQPELLNAAISWMPASSTIVAATDHDKDGRSFATRIAALCEQHAHVTFERHEPKRVRFADGRIGKDWNDLVQWQRDCELQEPTKRLAAADPGRTSGHDRDFGIPAETMEYFRRSTAAFERAFGTTRESIQSEICAHLARDGATPDRSGRGGPDR